MAQERIVKGFNGNLIITDSGVRITRGGKGWLLQGGRLRGEKFVPWESIVAVQFKKAHELTGAGYLQLSLRGGSESKAGLMEAVDDENTVTWANIRPRQKNKEFAEARDLILARIAPAQDAVKTCPECAEDVKAAANVCRFCGHRFDGVQ